MTTNIDPLAQFAIRKIVNINILGVDISITNSTCFMFVALTLAITYFMLALQAKAVIPSRFQVSAELLYDVIVGILDQNIGPKGRKFVPIIFTLFMFILLCNLLGMLPFGFTVTSHISVTFTLGILIFMLVTVLGFINHGSKFLSLFLPKGVPLWLAPLMILIELFTYLARPISLSLRLMANMVAGHVLLKVMAGFIVSLWVVWKIIPIPIIILLIGFEVFVAILQAYIFSVLACVYLNDAVNLH